MYLSQYLHTGGEELAGGRELAGVCVYEAQDLVEQGYTTLQGNVGVGVWRGGG